MKLAEGLRRVALAVFFARVGAPRAAAAVLAPIGDLLQRWAVRDAVDDAGVTLVDAVVDPVPVGAPERVEVAERLTLDETHGASDADSAAGSLVGGGVDACVYLDRMCVCGAVTVGGCVCDDIDVGALSGVELDADLRVVTASGEQHDGDGERDHDPGDEDRSEPAGDVGEGGAGGDVHGLLLPRQARDVGGAGVRHGGDDRERAPAVVVERGVECDGFAEHVGKVGESVGGGACAALDDAGDGFDVHPSGESTSHAVEERMLSRHVAARVVDGDASRTRVPFATVVDEPAFFRRDTFRPGGSL